MRSEMTKNKRISFRLNPYLFYFVQRTATENNMETSDVIRNMLQYVYMEWFLGRMKEPLMPQIREEFDIMMKDIKKQKESVKKFSDKKAPKLVSKNGNIK